MPTNRESSELPAGPVKEQSTSPFSAQPELNMSKATSDQKSLADAFRQSYSQMHREIYSELYRLPGAMQNMPDWLNTANSPAAPPADFNKGQSLRKTQTRTPWLLPGIMRPDQREITPQPPGPNQHDITPQPPRPEEKPETAPPPRPLDTANEGKITREGNNLHLEYPGGKKTRDIVLDSSGKAQEIITKDPSGTMHLMRRGDRWVAQIQGLELQMPGKIEANDRGEVTFEMEQGIFRREKPDGATVQEKTNADGSRMSFYTGNSVEKLTRKDGSSLQVSQDGKTIVETLPNSNRQISWTKRDESAWISDTQPAQQRKNFKVETNGTTSWDGPDGLKFVIRGDGSMMVQGDGQARIQLDEKNRIKSIDYGKKTREFDYFDDTNEIKSTVIKDQEKNSSNTFTRENPGSDQWKIDNGQIWTGEIKVGPGGVYSYKPNGNAVQEADRDGRWYTMWTDGNITRDVIGSDGSRLSYENGKLRKALAGDGTSAQISEEKIAIDNPRSGERVTWTKEGESWKSDSPRFPGAKKDLQINEKCEVSFTAEDGTKHAIRPDGKEVITRKDGVQLELNDSQQIDRITKGDRVRTIERGPDGSIIRVTDKSKDSQRSVLERLPADGISSVEIGKEGDLVIKRADGTSKLERADFSSVTKDKDGLPLAVTNSRGDSRTYTWTGEGQGKTVTAIQDLRHTSRGDVTETWTRKPGSNDFSTIDSRGKEKIHPGVQLSPDGNGDYSYKSKDGSKDVVSRLGGSDGGSELSASVEEARESLLDEMRDKLPEANFKRLQEMMQKLENRMSDRSYLRKLAGVKSADNIDDEIQKDVQSAYDNLRQMVAKGDDGAFFDQKTRVKLAENFMYNAMEPTFIDQGPASSDDWNGHGTCWITTGEIWGMTQHPGAMADYLRQVCLDGKVTTRNGGEGDSKPQTCTFSKGLLTFSGSKQEDKWTIEDRENQSRMGYRSPVSKIFQYTLPMLSGSRREGDVDGGMYETLNLVGPGHTRGVRDILYMVTGDVPVDRGEANYSPGHLLGGNRDFNLSMA